MARWAAFLLGETRLIAPDGTVVVPSAPIAALLALLVSRRGRRISRTQAAQLIWEDQDEDHARHCLATSLWRFKGQVAGQAPPILVEAETLTLDRRIWVDVLAFQLRVRDAAQPAAPLQRIRRAVEGYRGDFLAGSYAEWALVERERLACLHLDALIQLATLEARAGNYPAAIRQARLACQLEPLREDAHRLLMRAYADSGNRALAIKQYRTCARILIDELGVGPMDDTNALAQLLCANGTDSPDQSIIPRAPPNTTVPSYLAASPAPAGSIANPQLHAAMLEGRNAIASALAALDRSLNFL